MFPFFFFWFCLNLYQVEFNTLVNACNRNAIFLPVETDFNRISYLLFSLFLPNHKFVIQVQILSSFIMSQQSAIKGKIGNWAMICVFVHAQKYMQSKANLRCCCCDRIMFSMATCIISCVHLPKNVHCILLIQF